MHYKKPKPGEWVQPVRCAYKLACCDCALVHSMHFRVQNGRAQFKAYRDEKATRLLRKKERIVCRTNKRK